jgi:hypothetical protein
VAFYVPLGPRGLLIRIGSFMHGVWGGVIYELARRRRELVPSNPPLPVIIPDLMMSD